MKPGFNVLFNYGDKPFINCRANGNYHIHFDGSESEKLVLVGEGSGFIADGKIFGITGSPGFLGENDHEEVVGGNPNGWRAANLRVNEYGNIQIEGIRILHQGLVKDIKEQRSKILRERAGY